MFWHKFSFWFWSAFMIPFNLGLATLNFGSEKWFMLGLNILTIVLSAFNAYIARETIKNEEQFRNWLAERE